MLFFILSLLLIIVLLNQNNLSNNYKNLIFCCILISLYYICSSQTIEHNDECIIRDPAKSDPDQCYPNFQFNNAGLIYSDKNKYNSHKIYTRCLDNSNNKSTDYSFFNNYDNNCHYNLKTTHNDVLKTTHNDVDLYSDFDNDRANKANENYKANNEYDEELDEYGAEPTEEYINNHHQKYGYSNDYLKYYDLNNRIELIKIHSGFKFTIYESDFKEPNVDKYVYTYVNGTKKETKEMMIPYTLRNDKKYYHIMIDTERLMQEPVLKKMANDIDLFKKLTWNDFTNNNVNLASILNPNPGTNTGAIFRDNSSNPDPKTMSYNKTIQLMKTFGDNAFHHEGANKESTADDIYHSTLKWWYENPRYDSIYDPVPPNYIKRITNNSHFNGHKGWNNDKNSMNIRELLEVPGDLTKRENRPVQVRENYNGECRRRGTGGWGWEYYPCIKSRRVTKNKIVEIKRKFWWSEIDDTQLQSILDFHTRQLVYGFKVFDFKDFTSITGKDVRKVSLYGPDEVVLSEEMLFSIKPNNYTPNIPKTRTGGSINENGAIAMSDFDHYITKQVSRQRRKRK
jgi:hypothetical protein